MTMVAGTSATAVVTPIMMRRIVLNKNGAPCSSQAVLSIIHRQQSACVSKRSGNGSGSGGGSSSRSFVTTTAFCSPLCDTATTTGTAPFSSLHRPVEQQRQPQQQPQQTRRGLWTTTNGSLSSTPKISSSSSSSSILSERSNNTITTAARYFSSSSKRDFYDVLGVSKSADKGMIKKAYFKLAKQYHPDQNQADEKAAEKFKEATDAYEVLKDGKKREMYDNYGHAGVDPNSGFEGGNPFGGNPFAGGGGGGFGFGDGSFHFNSSGGGGGGPGGQDIDPEELFEAIFGGGGGRARGPRRGADLQTRTRLSFREAVFGLSRDLKVRYQVRDRTTGRVETKRRTVTVDVPAGVEHGMTLRLAGEGSEGDPGAGRGSLLVQVLVDDDEYYRRDGVDVHTSVPVSMTQAVLGGTVDVQTLYGEVEVKVPRGCQINTKLLLRGQGIPQVNSGYGDRKGNQIVHLDIEIPKSINAKQEQLLREFDEETHRCGSGISGRLAAAAGSAFESFFGGSDTKKDDKDNSSNESETDDDTQEDKDMEREEKKAV